jgi:Phosphorylated CTD interacting factor 1 WW domain
MFDLDKPFGSQGNFFAYAKAHGDVLPAGVYEINPPWINVMFEKVAEILGNSDGSDITAIVVAPNWEGAKYITDLNALLSKSNYRTNSNAGVKHIRYQHDANHKDFVLETRYWIFSTQSITESVRRLFE